MQDAYENMKIEHMKQVDLTEAILSNEGHTRQPSEQDEMPGQGLSIAHKALDTVNQTINRAKEDEILQRDQDSDEVEDTSPIDVLRSSKVETVQE